MRHMHAIRTQRPVDPDPVQQPRAGTRAGTRAGARTGTGRVGWMRDMVHCCASVCGPLDCMRLGGVPEMCRVRSASRPRPRPCPYASASAGAIWPVPYLVLSLHLQHTRCGAPAPVQLDKLPRVQRMCAQHARARSGTCAGTCASAVWPVQQLLLPIHIRRSRVQLEQLPRMQCMPLQPIAVSSGAAVDPIDSSNSRDRRRLRLHRPA